MMRVLHVHSDGLSSVYQNSQEKGIVIHSSFEEEKCISAIDSSWDYDYHPLTIFELELALLVALQRENIWKGGGGAAAADGDVHLKNATSSRG